MISPRERAAAPCVQPNRTSAAAWLPPTRTGRGGRLRIRRRIYFSLRRRLTSGVPIHRDNDNNAHQYEQHDEHLISLHETLLRNAHTTGAATWNYVRNES